MDAARAAGLSDADYRKVRRSLDRAADELADDDPEKALRALLEATDELLEVTTPEGIEIRRLIDGLLLWVSREVPA